MTASRIFLGTMIVFAFALGLMGSVGFHGIAMAGDYYSDGRVVDNPGGGRRFDYNNKVQLPPWQDMSGAWHPGRTADHGQGVWFPQGTGQQPVAPPPPPPQQAMTNSDNNTDVGDTRAQDRDTSYEQKLRQQGIIHDGKWN